MPHAGIGVKCHDTRLVAIHALEEEEEEEERAQSGVTDGGMEPPATPTVMQSWLQFVSLAKTPFSKSMLCRVSSVLSRGATLLSPPQTQTAHRPPRLQADHDHRWPLFNSKVWPDDGRK